MEYLGVFAFIVLLLPCFGKTGDCACSQNVQTCSAIYQMPVDFQTAKDNCEEKGGRLMSVHTNRSEDVIRFLLENTIGSFWVDAGHSLGDCAGETRAPEESGAQQVDLNNREIHKRCDPLCSSVSSEGSVPKPCKEKLNGLLCEDTNGAFCGGGAVILDANQCLFAPCEHRCQPVAAGYTCSCSKRFRPNLRDPRRCDFYCETSICEAVCMNGGATCWCPEGFVRSGQTCEDIDECDSNHDCAHKCVNTLGGYTCECFEPYVKVNGTKCVHNSIVRPRSPAIQVATTPFPKHTVGSLSTPGEYIGLTIFLVAAVFASLALVRYLRGRKVTAQETGSPNYSLSFSNAHQTKLVPERTSA